MPKQKTDLFSPVGPAINYVNPGQRWSILDGVTVGSTAVTVLSAFDNSKLTNKGNLYGPTICVNFTGQKNGTVVNKENGFISGGNGVVLGGSGTKNMTLKNAGSILGSQSIGVTTEASNADLYNTGSIYGLQAGIRAKVISASATEGPMIENSGLIHSAQFGVAAQVASGLTATIVNMKGGVIKGDVQAINSGAAKLSLENHGKLKGDIYASSDNDKVVNKGAVKGDVILRNGNDVYRNKGGKADKVFGQDGNDKLVAGNSKDQFVFDGPLNPATNVDRVKNFESGKDVFFLDRGVFTVLLDGTLPGSAFEKGKQADDFDDRIIYDKKEGKLYYDEDGSLGGFVQVQIAQLDPGQKLGAGDFSVMLFV